VPNARYVVFCLDKDCVKQLGAAGVKAEYLQAVDDGWRAVKTWFGVAKFLGALELLERGEHAIVTDGDFVLRKDVTKLLRYEHDIEMQGGIFKDDELWRHFYEPKAYNSVLCIGLFFDAAYSFQRCVSARVPAPEEGPSSQGLGSEALQ
jgi:hypothetical protein